MARTLERQFIQERAYSILKNAYGPGAQFHPGQLDAIVSVVSGRDSLVVEKTGWGKSLVYFVSTKILRENGAGPTLIISPRFWRLWKTRSNPLEYSGSMR